MIDTVKEKVLESGVVRYEKAQSLSNAEKNWARQNIGVGAGSGGDSPSLKGFLRYDEDQRDLITEAQAAMVRRALRIPEELTQRVYHVRQIVIHRDDHFTHLTRKTVSRRSQVTQNTTFFLGRRQAATE